MLNFSLTGNSFKINLRRTIALAICFFVASCAGAKKKPDSSGSPQNPSSGSAQIPGGLYGPSEPFGPLAPQVYGPDILQIRPIVLVLGPGMARGLTYIGVIRALNANKIPIAAIYSAEMGSLLGGLYAMDSNINHFEFSLLKYKTDLFRDKSLLSDILKKPSSGSSLEEQLKKSFGTKEIQTAKIPLKIAVHSVSTDADLLLDQGCAWCAIRSSLAQPEFFSPSESTGAPMMAADKSERLLIDQAKQLSVGSVVTIDLGNSDTSGADIVIKPDLQGIKDSDFEKESDLAFRGKTATLSVMSEIRRQVGLPQP